MDGAGIGLEARVEALAREVRWMRRVTAAVAAAGALALTAGTQSAAPRPKEVRASRFVLVDAAGAALAALETGEGGMPRLVLSAAGAPRATLRLGEGGAPALELRDAAGGARVVLESAAAPRLWIGTREGRGGVALTTESGIPRLALADAEARDRMWVALRMGSPAIQFLTPQGIARSGLTTFNDDGGVAVISAADGATPGLVLYGKDRTIAWSAP